MSHASDCALIVYGNVDPSTLKAPLQCDCDRDDHGGDGDSDDSDTSAAQSAQSAPAGPSITLTGARATAYQRLQLAAQVLRKAQAQHAKALEAFTEAVSG